MAYVHVSLAGYAPHRIHRQRTASTGGAGETVTN